MNKFFFVSQVFYPDEVSTAGLFTDLSIELVKNGIIVEVWCAQPSYTTHQRQTRYVNYEGINIYYLPSTNFKKHYLLGRLINYLTFSVSLFLKIMFSNERSYIFTVTNPPVLGVIVNFACTLKRRKFIYIVSDVFPDGLIRLGKLSENNIVSRIWNSLNKKVLTNADKIIVLGRDMIDWVISLNPNVYQKIHYIPHWQNSELIKPAIYYLNPFVLKHQLQDKFVVQYSGNMGLWHDMALFGRIAKKLECSNVYFVFIGDGMRRQELFNEWNNLTPANVKVLPYQPREVLGESLSACHVALISLKKGLEGMAVPSKLYGIMAAGIPVLAVVPENSEIAMVVKEENCGYVINPDDENGLIQAIMELRNSKLKRNIFGVNARKAFIEKYTTKVIVKKYIELINSK